MADLPADQIVHKTLKTNRNPAFEKIAADLCPQLKQRQQTPQRLVRFIQDETQYFGVRAEHAGDVANLSARLWGRKDEFILDFGIHLVGHVSFRIEAEGLNIDAPCRLRLSFGESPFDVTRGFSDVETWISTSWLPDEVINIDFMPEDVHLPRRYSFRYVRFEIVDTSAKYKVRISDAVCSAESTISPDHLMPSFTYPDPIYLSLDDISIYTLRDCMQTVFEDGPRRDRRLWIGDLRLQALTNYATFRDFDLVKRCLFMFAALPREDRSLPACLFEKPKLAPASDYILSYDALFGATVRDYVLASGDIESGRLLWDTVLGSLEVPLTYIDPATNTFNPSRGNAWIFLDWSPGLDCQAGMHGLLLYCLCAVEELASIISKPFPHDQVMEFMKTAATNFFDAATNTIVSGPAKQVSLTSAAWLTLSNALPEELSRSALLNALADPQVSRPSTPYAYHHLVDALASVGLYDQAVQILKTYWGGMVNAGADTFWECFDDNDPNMSPYGDVRNNSFCHAWSCTPALLLRTKLKSHVGGVESGSITMRELDERRIKCMLRG